MTLVQHVPVTIVDCLLVNIANFIFGDLSRYGIVRPKPGPLALKSKTGRSSVVDVGTAGLIKKGIIKVRIYTIPSKLIKVILACYK
jgi:indole-3-pyruvate monooxygenase